MYLKFELLSATYDQFKALLDFNKFDGAVYGIIFPGGNFGINAIDPNRKYLHRITLSSQPSDFITDFPAALLVTGSLSIDNQF